MGDDAMKEIIDANEAGTLTDKFIQERRPYLNHTDYSAAIKLRRGGAENDSKDTLAAILPDLDTRDLKGSLTDALLANRITTATYKTLLERNQAALKDDQPQSPYKQGRDYIKQILDPSALGMGANSVMGGLAAQSRADALMEYDAWADAHKEQIKNDPQVATRYAAEVGQRYRLIDLSQNEAALGLPRFYQGGRGEMSEGTLKKAIADTQRAYDDGQLSAAEYAAQVRLLQGWDAVVKKRAGATAQIPGGPNGQGGNR
jgi:hypothetical protein